jgi:hypothetical protein
MVMLFSLFRHRTLTSLLLAAACCRVAQAARKMWRKRYFLGVKFYFPHALFFSETLWKIIAARQPFLKFQFIVLAF